MKFFTQPARPDDADDVQLLQRYRKSDDLAVLGTLYQKYMQLIYGVCLKYLNDEELAKDAVMNIFEELITKVKNHDIQQFRSWLYVLARNHCLMQLRSGRKMETVEVDDFMEFDPVLHPEDNDRETALTALEKCMDKLKEGQKQSVDLFYLKQKCYQEIANETGFSLNEVKSYIQNGKRNLKICLEQSDEQ